MTGDDLINQKIAQRHMQGNWQRLMVHQPEAIIISVVVLIGFYCPISIRIRCWEIFRQARVERLRTPSGSAIFVGRAPLPPLGVLVL